MPSIADISTAKLYHAEVGALARLHLWFTSETQQMIADFSKRAQALIMRYANKDGVLDHTGALRVQQTLWGAWGDVVNEWTQLLQGARHTAAMLPFGVMEELHGRLMINSLVTESTPLAPLSASLTSPHFPAENRGRILEEAVRDGVFEPQIRVLMDAASEYLYGDGLNLSGRIWKIDRDTRDMLNQIILSGVSNSKSALDIAKELEVFLGANEDCPRWTSTRLYHMTKKEIAGGDLRGLVSGDACDGQGVAYNALRLARTELQKIHALATDKVLANSPWVEQEQINLSKGHPEPDECDDVIDGGEKGDGIYPVGTIELPLHPNCLCYKTSVLMPEDEFINKLADWTQGGSWQEMDDYAQFIGAGDGDPQNVDFSNDSALVALGVWMFGQELKLL